VVALKRAVRNLEPGNMLTAYFYIKFIIYKLTNLKHNLYIYLFI